MKITRRSMKIAALVGAGCAAALTAGAQTIPSDPTPSCTVSSTTFNGWFASGQPSVNGFVNPADSIAFQPSSNCAFYTWSEQMFMWLTSPASSAPPATAANPSYSGTGPVFNSNVFYQVVPTATGFAFVAQTGSPHLTFNLRSAQVGPLGQQIMFDKNHVRHEIAPVKLSPRGKQLIPGADGKPVEIGSAKLDPKGRPILLDTKGKPIKPKLGMLSVKAPGEGSQVQEVKVAGKSVFLDQFGNPIVPDQGQAGGGGVLVAQNGSLVYYATFVNDVYAYYLTQVKNMNGGSTPTGTLFPTSQTDLDSIVAYAKAHGVTFPDPNALAIEVKTSWVVPSALNAANYVIVNADVPTYNKSNAAQWKPDGVVNVPLALVGIHVVGSATNHPEMIWSTFEHFGNAPDAAYQYVNSGNQTVTVPQNTSGSWLFCQTNCVAPFNSELAKFDSTTKYINSTNPPAAIVPSNTIRWHALGAAYNTSPNAPDTAPASNSEAISINNSILGQMLNGDVRKNYYFVGSTWSNSGAQPDNPFYGNPNPSPLPSFPPGNEIGTSQVSNATMETYQQGSSDNTFAQDGNCFQCHNNNSVPANPKATVQVSHLWNGLAPLYPPAN